MTKPDPILAEIYATRAAISERHGGDLRAMIADAGRRQGSTSVVPAHPLNGESDNHAMHAEPPGKRSSDGESTAAAR